MAIANPIARRGLDLFWEKVTNLTDPFNFAFSPDANISRASGGGFGLR